MTESDDRPDFFGFSTPLSGVAALMLAMAYGCEKAPSENPSSADDPPTVSRAADEEQPSSAREIDVQEDANELRPENFYGLAWAGDETLCGDVLNALNESFSHIGEAENYADAQALRALGTGQNVQWVKAENGESAMLDYYNDGVARAVERRRGMLSGNQIINLWVGDDKGGFTRLDFGHAGANTAEMPEIDNLHTKLTYSVADVVDVDGRYITLVAPLSDIDASGEVFAVSWRAKGGTTSPRAAEDYYSYIRCIAAPIENKG